MAILVILENVWFVKVLKNAQETSDSNWITETASANGNNRFTIKNLKPNSHYELKIRAENEIGWSKHGKDFVFSTIEGQ